MFPLALLKKSNLSAYPVSLKQELDVLFFQLERSVGSSQFAEHFTSFSTRVISYQLALVRGMDFTLSLPSFSHALSPARFQAFVSWNDFMNVEAMVLESMQHMSSIYALGDYQDRCLHCQQRETRGLFLAPISRTSTFFHHVRRQHIGFPLDQGWLFSVCATCGGWLIDHGQPWALARHIQEVIPHG